MHFLYMCLKNFPMRRAGWWAKGMGVDALPKPREKGFFYLYMCLKMGANAGAPWFYALLDRVDAGH